MTMLSFLYLGARLSQLKEVSNVAGLACLYLEAKAVTAEGGV
jgi:hypothetical protein